jgi:hypothetical protein
VQYNARAFSRSVAAAGETRPLPVTVHPFQRWFVRAVLSLALVTPAVLWVLARGLNADRSYTIEIDFVSSVDGALQVFYDRGGGITAAESVAVPVTAGTTPETRALNIPGGAFRRFRIDPPGQPGRYTIAGVRVRDWDGKLIADFPVSALVLEWQVTLVSAGPPLVVESPPGSNDPQLTLTLTPPLDLHRDPRSTWWLARTSVAFGVAALVLVLVAGRLAAPLEPWASRLLTMTAGWAAARPAAAIVIAAIVATLAAMYPIVFLGKSLVSPNNGPAPLLYDRAPFTPGNQDREIEELRGVDNGAGMWQFVPYAETQRLALARGEAPLWNRYNGAGRPLWGQGQSQILDPLHWPTVIAPDPAIGWDIKFVLHRAVFAMGAGMAVLALTASWPAAVGVAGLAPFAGYFLFRLNHSAQFSFTYATWLMWAWFRLQSATSGRELVRSGRWLAVTTVLVLVASPPKEAVVMLLCCHATGALACLMTRGRRFERFRTAAVAGVVAVLLAAPHWLIFASTLSQSLTNYDTPGARFATWPFAVVIAFGVLKPGGLLPGAHPAIAALALAAAAAGRITWRRPAARAAVLGPVMALAVAFGAIPEWVIVSVPFFANIIQIDYTFVGAALVLLCITAGLGLAGLIDTGPGAARLTRTVLPTAACAAALAVLLWQGDAFASLNLFVESWALLLAAVLATCLVPLTRIAALRWPAPLPVLTTALVALLLVAPDGLHAVSGSAVIDRTALQPRTRTRLTVESPAVQAIRRDTQGPARVVGLNQVLFSGSQALYRLESIGGPDALELPFYEQLMNASGVERYWVWNHLITGPDLARIGRFLDLLNVGYILAAHGVPGQGLPPGAENLPPLPMAGEDLVLAAKRPTAWPRAFFVDHASQYKGVGEFVAQLNASNGPFASIEADAALAKAAAGGADWRTIFRQADLADEGAGTYEAATNYRLTGNRTAFRIHAPGPGLAVLSEAWMANDFVATLNGASTPYFRVNHAFKGVRIPAAGDWTVEFTYRPALWATSWMLFAFGLLAMVFFRLGVG